MFRHSTLPRVACLALCGLSALSAAAQRAENRSEPHQDVEQVIGEANTVPQDSLLTFDRPFYTEIQRAKKDLSDKYGINFAVENTTIYQITSGVVDPNDALVNTLGLFATWKIFRDPNGKDFGGIGFQGEIRGDPLSGHFTDMTNSLGTLWAPNDSTSDSYSKVNQLWWGQRFADGRFGVQIGKIDPGAYINGNRFAGSGNTQFFSQPFATNPARSFPDNGLGFMLRFEPNDRYFVHFTMSDADANSKISPFTTIRGHWFYAAEAGYKPVIPGLGQGIYRVMLYQRHAEGDREFGWSISADQNLSDAVGVFLRYGGNDGSLDNIQTLVSAGVCLLKPFDRKSDQAGIAFSYTHPTQRDLRDEYSTEIYYRAQLTQGIELSGSTQLIANPSAANRDSVAVFGLRLRFLY